MEMKQSFNKNIFTARIFFGDLFFMLGKSFSLIGAFRNKKITRVLAEKIMTVSSAVNGCRYCEWFHAKQALSSGISQAEIKNMLNLQFHAEASDFELPALLYTQHYAETNRNPDADMTKGFTEFYGEKTASHIYLLIRLIAFGNLGGNTWEAVLNRFKGKPVENSNLLFEIVFLLFSFWIMLPAMLMMKKEGVHPG
jgi:AhpD family alkylhydroperoxidase